MNWNLYRDIERRSRNLVRLYFVLVDGETYGIFDELTLQTIQDAAFAGGLAFRGMMNEMAMAEFPEFPRQTHASVSLAYVLVEDHGIDRKRLASMTNAELLALPGIGRTSLAKIRAVFPCVSKSYVPAAA
jgi:hypothetical protein